MAMAEQSGAWWETGRFPVGTAGRWRIGPLELWIQRLEGEWRIASEQGDDPLDDALEREVPCVIDGVLDRESTERYASNSKTEVIRLAAALADRSVVTRSDKPLHVPPGEEISVFVSSPLWVRIEAGEPGKLLRELPVFRPSDTWFGPNTREGELCYASRTHHRLRLEQIPARPHRAVTSVLVRNRLRGCSRSIGCRCRSCTCRSTAAKRGICGPTTWCSSAAARTTSPSFAPAAGRTPGGPSR